MVCNFANYDEKQYLDGVDEMEKELLAQPKGSRIPLIIDVTNSNMTQVTSARGKKSVEVLGNAGVVSITAMVGITGLKKIIAQAISRDVHFANDMESAKEWVIAQ